MKTIREAVGIGSALLVERSALLVKLENVASHATRIGPYACYADGEDRWIVEWVEYVEGVEATAKWITKGYGYQDTGRVYLDLRGHVPPHYSGAGNGAGNGTYSLVEVRAIAGESWPELAEWLGVAA